MISSDTARNLLEIGLQAPFDRLTRSELLLVAQHIRRRHYSPGEVMLAGGAVAERLVVIVDGAATIGQSIAPPIFDAQSMLFGLPVRGDHVAGAQGATALCLAKPHLFTIARECPDFIVGLTAMAAEWR